MCFTDTHQTAKVTLTVIHINLTNIEKAINISAEDLHLINISQKIEIHYLKKLCNSTMISINRSSKISKKPYTANNYDGYVIKKVYNKI